MKIFRSLLIIIVILCTSTIIGCKKGNDEMKSDQEILKIVNNNTSKEKIITKKINIESFNDINFYGRTLGEVNKIYQIECLRSNKDIYYAIFNSNNDGWLYMLFELINNKYIATDIFYYETPIYKKDFEKLIVNESQIEDVRNIDKYGNEILYASSIEPSSFHNTLDGYEILIEYKDYPQKYVISAIKIHKSHNSVIDSLLEIDIIEE